MIFKNKNFFKLLISFTCIIGFFNLYGTITNEYFTKYGLTSDEASYIAACGNFIGILASLGISMIIDKYKNYRKSFLILNLIGLTTHVLQTILIELFKKYAFIILFILFTVCLSVLIPIFTCSMDLVVELTYPVGESISGGIIMSSNQISGITMVK